MNEQDRRNEQIFLLNDELRSLHASKRMIIKHETWTIDATGFHIKMAIKTALGEAEIDIKDKDAEMVRRAVKKVLEQYLS